MTQDTTSTVPPNADLWVLAGQSNMVGSCGGEPYEAPSGDTRMEEWTPDYEGHPHMALYRATVRRLRAVRRPLSGVLWYQGESDTFDGKAKLYVERMKKLVAAFRRDTGRPDLPFVYVQISTCTHQAEDELPDWNLIQELQRKLEPELASGGMVASIDLPRGDGIHLSPGGQQRLGRRLARLVRRQAYGDRSVEKGPRPLAIERDSSDPCRLLVQYGQVNERLLPEGAVEGFSVREAGTTLNLACGARVLPESPCCVEIRTRGSVPPQADVWYGKGMAPLCNLTDAADMAAPVFGPWRV